MRLVLTTVSSFLMVFVFLTSHYHPDRMKIRAPPEPVFVFVWFLNVFSPLFPR